MAKGGKRTGAGRPSTGRTRKYLYITNDEAMAVKNFIVTLRSGIQQSMDIGISKVTECEGLQSVAEKSAMLLALTKELSEECHGRIVTLKNEGKTNNVIAETLSSEGFLSADNGQWNVSKLKKYTLDHMRKGYDGLWQ